MTSRDDLTTSSAPEQAGEPAGALFMAQSALAWERLWPALWPAAGLTGLFVALAWIGIPSLLNPWVHLVLLLAALGGIGWLLWRGLRGFRFPGVTEARRRIERDSNLRHRPLSTLTDSLGGGARDPLAMALWQAAQERARRQVDRLTLRSPHPNLAARDPWALRAGVGLLLVVGATVSWGSLSERLAAALLPPVGIGGIVQPAMLEAWITPPDYTGLPPVFLTRRAGPAVPQTASADGDAPAEPAAVAVPEGSIIQARVTGGYGTPELAANGQTAPFEPVAGGFQSSHEITSGNRIAVTQAGRELQSWNIVVVPDQAPGIAFRQPPSATERQALRLDYTAADDYGIEKVTATVRLGVELPDTVDQSR